jgi:hypothetical protein
MQTGSMEGRHVVTHQATVSCTQAGAAVSTLVPQGTQFKASAQVANLPEHNCPHSWSAILPRCGQLHVLCIWQVAILR